MGDNSPEREVSLQTGAAIVAALETAGHRVAPLEIPSTQAVLSANFSDMDLVFPALHGAYGEDGHLQALLDIMGIPYALSGQLASAMAMNKAISKRIMASAGISTPDWLLIALDKSRPHVDLAHIKSRASNELGFPLVIKLNSAGSSVGVAIVESPEAFSEAFNHIMATSTTPRTEILLEKFIPGRELTAAILLGRRLPLLEIRPTEGFYDYAHKYTAGASEYLCPAPVDSPYYENMCADALKLYDLLGCQGTARVDFRFDGTNHYCLEINTIPGMTEHSLVPKAAAAVGISFEALVEDLCIDALTRRGIPYENEERPTPKPKDSQ